MSLTTGLSKETLSNIQHGANPPRYRASGPHPPPYCRTSVWTVGRISDYYDADGDFSIFENLIQSNLGATACRGRNPQILLDALAAQGMIISTGSPSPTYYPPARAHTHASPGDALDQFLAQAECPRAVAIPQRRVPDFSNMRICSYFKLGVRLYYPSMQPQHNRARIGAFMRNLSMVVSIGQDGTEIGTLQLLNENNLPVGAEERRNALALGRQFAPSIRIRRGEDPATVLQASAVSHSQYLSKIFSGMDQYEVGPPR